MAAGLAAALSHPRRPGRHRRRRVRADLRLRHRPVRLQDRRLLPRLRNRLSRGCGRRRRLHRAPSRHTPDSHTPPGPAPAPPRPTPPAYRTRDSRSQNHATLASPRQTITRETSQPPASPARSHQPPQASPTPHISKSDYSPAAIHGLTRHNTRTALKRLHPLFHPLRSPLASPPQAPLQPPISPPVGRRELRREEFRLPASLRAHSAAADRARGGTASVQDPIHDEPAGVQEAHNRILFTDRSGQQIEHEHQVPARVVPPVRLACHLPPPAGPYPGSWTRQRAAATRSCTGLRALSGYRRQRCRLPT